MNINWKVRFNKKNITFIIRFIGAALIPVLSFLGMDLTDITSWQTLGQVLLEALKNPYLLALVVINALNLIPDPTTQGISDSETALTYSKPK